MLSDLDYCVAVNFISGTYLPSSWLVVSSASVPVYASSSSMTATATADVTSTSVSSATASATALTSTPSKFVGSITTPLPIQTGMVSDCDEFHLVVGGDECETIASDCNITLADFYLWNPAVGSSCASLWVDDYVCVGITESSSSTVVTSSPTSTFVISAVTTTSASTAEATPTPIESDMVDDCDAFHLVVGGDECETIASDAGITLDEFYEWNPTVGDSCSSLWVGYYVCIGTA